MGKIARAAAMVTWVLLAACSRNPAPDALPAAIAGPAAENPVIGRIPDTASILNLRKRSGADAAAFNGNLTALDRIGRIMKAAGGPVNKIDLGLEGFGSRTADKPALEYQPESRAEALYQSGAGGLGKASADPEGFSANVYFEGDTAWFDYSDSAKGRVLWVHVFRDSEEDLHALVRDSLVYRWPLQPDSWVLLSSNTWMLKWAGGEYHTSLSDADGDGALNTAPEGMKVRIRKERTTVSADTAWKSSWIYEQGHDENEDGLAVSFADTTFIGGKAVQWTRTSDGDGDGFVLRADAAGRLMVNTETFVLNGDGTGIYSRNAYGPGADGDYFTPEDNTLYPYSVCILSARGDTLSVSRNGDADGDGLYSDPAPGARNRVWQSNRYADRDGYRSYRDSTVKSLNDLADDGDDRVEFHAAWAVLEDGSEARITSEPKVAQTGFVGSDTVVVWESHSYPPAAAGTAQASIAAGTSSGLDRDSSLRVSWIIPGDLADPADDKVVWWSDRTWYKRGGDLAYASVEFTPKTPLPSGGEPGAGTLVRREEYADSAQPGRRMVRLWRSDVLDPAGNAWAWNERRYFSDGDSTEEAGRRASSGGSVYATTLDHSVRSSGWYDGASGAFRDTLRFIGGGDQAGFTVREGVYAQASGEGDYACTYISGSGESSHARIRIEKEIPGLAPTSGSLYRTAAGGDSSVYRMRGMSWDSAYWEHRSGDTLATFAAALHADGSRLVSQTVRDGKGALLAQGGFGFRTDGSGSGILKVLPGDGTKTSVGLDFDADGTLRIDSPGTDARAEASGP